MYCLQKPLYMLYLTLLPKTVAVIYPSLNNATEANADVFLFLNESLAARLKTLFCPRDKSNR